MASGWLTLTGHPTGKRGSLLVPQVLLVPTQNDKKCGAKC